MAKRRVKRHYQSDVRAASARETREAIQTAARRLIAARGYAGASIEAIARDAGVAVQTVYAVFGTKAALLESLLDAMEDQAEIGAYRSVFAGGEADLDTQLRTIAHFLAQLFTRGADLITAARAAGADPKLRALARKGLLRHRREVTRLTAVWQESGLLRPGLAAAEAADTLNAITNYTVFAELRDFGWSRAKYEAWLVDAMKRLVL